MKIFFDGDIFVILLEGWEKEGNVVKVKIIFGEMVVRVGWDAKYMLVYDVFLIIFVRGL